MKTTASDFMNSTLISEDSFFWSLTRSVAVFSLLLLNGCSSADDRSGLLDKTLGVVGLQRSSLAETSAERTNASSTTFMPRPSLINLRVHAGSTLNIDRNGRSLSVIAKVYQLRRKEAFQNAAFDDFLTLDKRPSLAPDVVEVREIVLTPGTTYEAVESVGPDAPYFAVVALFRAPAEQRWRFVFETRPAATSGVTLGVHGCAMSVSTGQALGASPETARVAGVRCPA